MARIRTESFNVLMAGALVVLAVIIGLWFVPAEDPSPVAADLLDEVTSGLMEPTVSPNADQVSRLIEKGRLALDAQLYVGLERSSAAWFFRAAQDLDPGNAAAAEGFDAVVAGLALLADESLSAGRYGDAVDWLARARELESEHDAVQAVASRFASEQLAIAKRASEALESGAHRRAEQLLMLARSLGPDSGAQLAVVSDRLAAAEAERLSTAKLRKENLVRNSAIETARETRDDVARQVEALIGQAANRVASKRLFDPADDSALHFLQQAAVLDPMSTAVADGLDAVMDALTAIVRNSLAALEVESAWQWLDDAGRAGLNHNRIEALRNDVVAVEIAQESARVIPFGQLRLVKYVPPEYASRLASRQVEGWVDVQFVVTRDGTTTQIEITDSSHENFFVDATLAALPQWQFEPRQFRGVAIDQRVHGRVRFALD